jgi:hypothetical protein
VTALDSASSAATRAAGPLTGFLARWLRKQLWPDISRTSLNRVKDDLADAVDHQETMFRDQLRSGPDRCMDLNLRRVANADLMAHGAARSQQGIGEYFRELAPPARLVVLGGPGAGKTVMANRLVLDLLDHRAHLPDHDRSREPVALRLNMADWSTDYDLGAWIIRRISSDYRLHPRTTRALVDQGCVLPVLDGLDQMDVATDDPGRARTALDHLNESPLQPMIVTCRTAVYGRVREMGGDAGLHGAELLELQPLTNTAVTDYLNTQHRSVGTRDDGCATLVHKIRTEPNGALANSLSKPWVLDLAATAVRASQPTVVDLAKADSTTEITERVLAGLIPAAATSPHSRGQKYSETQINTWMRALAHFLDQRRSRNAEGTEFSLAHIWLLAGPLRCRVLYSAVIGSLMAVLVAALYTVTLWPSFGYPVNVAVGLGFGICTGSLAALSTTLVDRHGLSNQRLAWRVPQRIRWRTAAGRSLWRGAAASATAGLFVWCIATLLFGSTTALTLGISAGIAIGTGAVLISWSVVTFTTTPEHQHVLDYQARRVVRDDALTGLCAGLIYGVGFGVALGWMVWSTYGTMWVTNDAFRFIEYGFGDRLEAALAHGVAVALTTGIACGAIMGSTAGRHAVAAVVFKITGTFASRPAQFLEWACGAGLLRVNGRHYSMRHETFQDWLLRTSQTSNTGDCGLGLDRKRLQASLP